MILQQEIPYGYAHCFAGKDNCPKADSCLRAIAAKLLTESKEPQPETVNTVNAMYREQLTKPPALSTVRVNPCAMPKA